MLSGFVFILFFQVASRPFQSFCAHVIIVKQAQGGGTVLNNNIIQANRSHRSRAVQIMSGDKYMK